MAKHALTYWPPRVGDIWEDDEGERYFARRGYRGPLLIMECNGYTYSPDEFAGRMSLIYRKDDGIWLP